MANDSLNHPVQRATSFKPNQREHELSLLLQQVSDQLSQASALGRVMLNSSFWDCENTVKYDYAWALSDRIDKAAYLLESSDVFLLGKR